MALSNRRNSNTPTTAPVNRMEPEPEATGLASFYTGGVIHPKLPEGEYTFTLLHDSLVKGLTPEKDHIRMEWAVEDRVIVDNQFAKGFPITLAQLQTQLNLPSTPVPQLLSMLKSTPVRGWISYVPVNGREYRNLSFIPPVLVQDDDDEDEDI